MNRYFDTILPVARIFYPRTLYDFGIPRDVIILRLLHDILNSVFCLFKSLKSSLPPNIVLNRNIVFSTKLRLLYPDVISHKSRPISPIFIMFCRLMFLSRLVGFSAASGDKTAFLRGGVIISIRGYSAFRIPWRGS